MYCGAPPDDAYCLDLLTRDEVILLAAFEGEEIIGGIGAFLLRKFEQARSEILLYDIAVGTGHRRRGVATAMVAHLRAIARQNDVWVITLNTEPGNPAAHLYRALGASEEDATIFDLLP